MTLTKLILMGIALVALLWLLIYLASKVGDVLQDRRMRNKARRAIREKGLEQVLADIDAELERLGQSIEVSKSRAATHAGVSGDPSTAYQGVYQEMRWLSLYRRRVLEVAGVREEP